MTDPELLQARAQKWRLDGQPVRTLDEARALPRVGRILPDVSDAARAAGADVHRSLGGSGRQAADAAARL